MSAYAYGRMARASVDRAQLQITGTGGRDQSTQDKIANSVAAVIPADVLSIHALALAVLTKTDDKGTTTITDVPQLQVVLPVLIVVTLVLFLVGRGGFSGWTQADSVKVAIPPLALLAWTGLTGTSALTPWLIAMTKSAVAQPLVVILAAALGLVLVAINTKLK